MTDVAGFVPEHTLSSKFKLYLKVREIKQIYKIVQEIKSLSPSQREKWVEEYGDYIHDAIDTYVEDSDSTLGEGVLFDDELMAMSQELVRTLRDTITTVEDMLYEEASLEG